MTMKTTKPNLTKDQRKRLFLLARLLDRVPRHNFDMRTWTTAPFGEGLTLAPDCGYAGCAIGWGYGKASIRGECRGHHELANDLSNQNLDVRIALFGSERGRGVTPKRVARDIRAFLKTGELPR